MPRQPGQAIQPRTDAVNQPEVDEEDVPDFGMPATSVEPTFTDDTEDMESLTGFKINEEEAAEDRSKLSPPTGDYSKKDRQPWVYRKSFNDQDKRKGDFSPKGRLQISFSGPIENEEYSGMVSFKLSPDRRFHTDYNTKVVDNTKFDGMYRLWLQALDYYQITQEENATTVQQVIDLISKDDEMLFRVVKGRDIGMGSFVMGFKVQV